MKSRHLIDAELAAAMDLSPAPPLNYEEVLKIRAEAQASAEELRSTMPPFPDINVTERFIPGPEGAPDVRALVYIPRKMPQPLPAILWIHGGGYVFGSAENDDYKIKKLVDSVGCAAISVNYRVAPESPFPGPLEDCYAALKWLHSSAAELNVDSARIAVGGESAGGGLAAGLVLLARDRAEVPVAYQLLIFPMLDDRTVTHPDPHPFAGEFLWDAKRNRFGWASYLGKEPGSEGISPYAAAARAEDFTGLPPTCISVGSLDLFLEENIEYARRLLRAGVPTELHVYPGAVHGFFGILEARITKTAIRDYMDALRRGLHPGESLMEE